MTVTFNSEVPAPPLSGLSREGSLVAQLPPCSLPEAVLVAADGGRVEC